MAALKAFSIKDNNIAKKPSTIDVDSEGEGIQKKAIKVDSRWKRGMKNKTKKYLSQDREEIHTLKTKQVFHAVKKINLQVGIVPRNL